MIRGGRVPGTDGPAAGSNQVCIRIPAPAIIWSRTTSSEQGTTPRRCCCLTCATTPGLSWCPWPRQSAVWTQRPAQVRLYHHHDGCRLGARRRQPRRGVHRHAASSHASLVCQALERGHTVFVEAARFRGPARSGPDTTVERTGNDRVMVGSTAGCASFYRSAGTVRCSPWAVRGSLLDQRGSAGPGQLVPQRGP